MTKMTKIKLDKKKCHHPQKSIFNISGALPYTIYNIYIIMTKMTEMSVILKKYI